MIRQVTLVSKLSSHRNPRWNRQNNTTVMLNLMYCLRFFKRPLREDRARESHAIRRVESNLEGEALCRGPVTCGEAPSRPARAWNRRPALLATVLCFLFRARNRTLIVHARRGKHRPGSPTREEQELISEMAID